MFRRGLRGNGWELGGESGCVGKVRVCRMQGRKESGARGLWCRDMRFVVMWEYGVVWGVVGGGGGMAARCGRCEDAPGMAVGLEVLSNSRMFRLGPFK